MECTPLKATDDRITFMLNNWSLRRSSAESVHFSAAVDSMAEYIRFEDLREQSAPSGATTVVQTAKVRPLGACQLLIDHPKPSLTVVGQRYGGGQFIHCQTDFLKISRATGSSRYTAAVIELIADTVIATVDARPLPHMRAHE